MSGLKITKRSKKVISGLGTVLLGIGTEVIGVVSCDGDFKQKPTLADCNISNITDSIRYTASYDLNSFEVLKNDLARLFSKNLSAMYPAYQDVKQEHLKVISIKNANTGEELKSGDVSVDLIGQQGVKFNVTFQVDKSVANNALDVNKGTTNEISFDNVIVEDGRPTLSSSGVNIHEIVSVKNFSDFKNVVQSKIIEQIKYNPNNLNFVAVKDSDVEFTKFEVVTSQKESGENQYKDVEESDFLKDRYQTGYRYQFRVTVVAKEDKHSVFNQSNGKEMKVSVSRVSSTGKPLLSECQIAVFKDVVIKNSYDDFKQFAVDKIVELVNNTQGYRGFRITHLDYGKTEVAAAATGTSISDNNEYEKSVTFNTNSELKVKVFLRTQGVNTDDYVVSDVDGTELEVNFKNVYVQPSLNKIKLDSIDDPIQVVVDDTNDAKYNNLKSYVKNVYVNNLNSKALIATPNLNNNPVRLADINVNEIRLVDGNKLVDSDYFPEGTFTDTKFKVSFSVNHSSIPNSILQESSQLVTFNKISTTEDLRLKLSGVGEHSANYNANVVYAKGDDRDDLFFVEGEDEEVKNYIFNKSLDVINSKEEYKLVTKEHVVLDDVVRYTSGPNLSLNNLTSPQDKLPSDFGKTVNTNTVDMTKEVAAKITVKKNVFKNPLSDTKENIL